MAKYSLVKDDTIEEGHHTLYRIQATQRIYAHNPYTGTFVKPGDLGGYVESEENLAQSGDSWLFPGAKAFSLARIAGHARVFGPATICGCAKIYGHATVYGPALINGNARIYNSATIGQLRDKEHPENEIIIRGATKIHGFTRIYRDYDRDSTITISGNIDLYGYTELTGISLSGDITIKTPITSYGVISDRPLQLIHTKTRKALEKRGIHIPE